MAVRSTKEIVVTTTTKHISATLGYVRDYLTDREVAGKPQDWFSRDGEPVSIEEARAYLDELQQSGVLYITSCDNLTPDGRCAGH